MKKLLVNLGGKMAAFADDIASYNDPARRSVNPATGTGGDAAGAGAATAAAGAAAATAGSDDGDPLHPVVEHLLRNVRSRNVRQHFARTPASEYTRQRQVTIQAATFNAGGKKPPPGFRLDDWLGASPAAGGMKGRWPKSAVTEADGASAGGTAAGAGGGGGDGGGCFAEGPDVVAIGFEELVPLNAGHVMGMLASGHVDAWDRCIAAYLNGEEWAAQRYSTTTVSYSLNPATAVTNAVALLDAGWQGTFPTRVGPQSTPAQSAGGSTVGAVSDGGCSSASVPAAGGTSTGRDGGGASCGGAGGEGDKYVQVASKQLVGVYLTVWVRSRLLPEVRGVQVTTVATGFGGYLGNKGAVAARMRLYDSSIAFVAAHLTAGEAEGDELRRNADVHDILRRAVFYGDVNGGAAGGLAMTAPHAALISASLASGHWPPGPATIMDHDVAIWVGDLNYRLAIAPQTGPTAAPSVSLASAAAAGGASLSLAFGGGGATVVPLAPKVAAASGSGGGGGGGGGAAGGVADRPTDAEVRAAIRGGRLDVLSAVDQLNRERAAGRVFRGWHEGRLTFAPTYKFKVGTNVYNGDEPGLTHPTTTPPAQSPSASSASLAGAANAAAQSVSSTAPLLEDPRVGGGSSYSGLDDLDPSVRGGTAGGGGDAAERHKRRTPAWCDRVLWWSRAATRAPAAAAAGGAGGEGEGGGGGGKPSLVVPRLDLLAYWRGEVQISDHKPVAAAFVAEVVSYDRRRIETILEAALRHVDIMLQSMRPKVIVEPPVLEAGEWVTLGRSVPLRLTLTNTGVAEAMFHFVPPPRHESAPPKRQQPSPGKGVKVQGGGGGGGGGKFGLDDVTPLLPAWLSAEPAEGTLQPGQTCELQLTVLVEGGPGGAAGQLTAAAATSSTATASAASAASFATRLDDIVILRIEDSGDKFISLGGRYVHSFVGMSLEALTALGRAPALPAEEAAALAERLGLGPLHLAPLAEEEEEEEKGGPDSAVASDSPPAPPAMVSVPKEVRALVSALLADSAAALQTPGIFVDSAEHLLKAAAAAGDAAAEAATPPSPPGAAGPSGVAADVGTGTAVAAPQPTQRESQRALLRRLEVLRLHLDAGCRVPPGSSPHDLAALMLLWARQLPQPLLPSALADAAAAAPPASFADAVALMRRHCTPAQLGVVLELRKVLRAALEPGVIRDNGLTVERLAAALAAWWFPPFTIGGVELLAALLLQSQK